MGAKFLENVLFSSLLAVWLPGAWLNGIFATCLSLSVSIYRHWSARMELLMSGVDGDVDTGLRAVTDSTSSLPQCGYRRAGSVFGSLWRENDRPSSVRVFLTLLLLDRIIGSHSVGWCRSSTLRFMTTTLPLLQALLSADNTRLAFAE
jgi:hypothetical protein